MGRLSLGAFLACSVALAGPAGAADIARVASSEPGNPFDLHVSIRWDRDQQRGLITRERAVDASEAPPFGAIVNGDELRYTRVRNVIVPRIGLGLYRDVELHLETPYVLADDQTWRYAFSNGVPVGGIPGSTSGIETNAVDAMNQPCAGPCPLFPVGAGTTVYHGGRAGDAKVGLAWGVFNDRKDATKPFWQVGLDVTLPTAALYNPSIGRIGTAWASPHAGPGNVGAFGEKVWKWDLHTVMSRRMGPIDPYFKAHVTGMAHSSATFSNCNRVADLALAGQMSNAAVTNCGADSWRDDAGAQLPWIAGLTFGTELIPYEKRAEDQKVSFDVRLWADYTSAQRFYNPLTDATGKLHKTEPFLTMGGFLGMYLRASKFVSLHATASLATQTAHFLTGERLGRADVGSNDVSGVIDDPGDPSFNPSLNPNFDWRWDAPGRRFRLTETSVFGLTVAGVLQF
jgi:hypothetical protein